MSRHLVSFEELLPGDILLCYKAAKVDPVGKKITSITESNYTHAAICIDTTTAAESLAIYGVVKTNIQDLVGRYDHIAVFRQPDAWRSDVRVKALNVFIHSLISSRSKYNLGGVLTFKKRHENHQLSLSDRLKAFFEDQSVTSEAKKNYFCSELVAECFVATGFIAPSAAVVYKSDVTSPGALGRDPTFGTFYGYLSLVPNYCVPATDEFMNFSSFKEIFAKND